MLAAWRQVVHMADTHMEMSTNYISNKVSLSQQRESKTSSSLPHPWWVGCAVFRGINKYKGPSVTLFRLPFHPHVCVRESISVKVNSEESVKRVLLESIYNELEGIFRAANSKIILWTIGSVECSVALISCYLLKDVWIHVSSAFKQSDLPRLSACFCWPASSCSPVLQMQKFHLSLKIFF